MKILITGGAGFIGSALIRYLINNTNDEIVNIDKLTYAGNLESLLSVSNSPRYHFYKRDICDFTAISKIVNEFQPDAIMHLAAESHVDRSIASSAKFIQTNITGTWTLLEVCKAYWEKLNSRQRAAFRFHHISTDEVFGSLHYPDEGAEEPLFFTETTAYAPSSPYSATKAASDHLVRAWIKTYDLPAIITNCSNNYGPYQFPEKLIPLVVTNALAGIVISVYGSGDQIRDWLYVEDHVRALYIALRHGEPGETYNIGAHNERTNNDVILKICNLLDQLYPKKVSYCEQISYVQDRYGHDQRYAIDATKISKNLGWIPQETFETGLKKTVNWYVKNKQWIENVRRNNQKGNQYG